MPVNPDEFRSALSRFPSGVTVVTSLDADGVPHGITVSAFSSVSLEPPLILVCVERTTGSHGAIVGTGRFVVNILAAGQDAISETFSLTQIDKFECVKCRKGTGGIPILEEALVSLECRLYNSLEAGDHTILIGEVEDVTIRDGSPLVYFHGGYRDLLDL